MSTKVTVKYAVRTDILEVTEAEFAFIRKYVDVCGSRVQAVKFIRAQYNVELLVAKNVVDAIIAMPNY